MRRLMWFTIGYAAACGLGAYLLRGEGMLLAGGMGLLLTIGAFSVRKNPVARRGMAVFLGITLGCTWFVFYEAAVLSPISGLDGQTLPMEIRVTDYNWETDYGSAVDGRVSFGGREYKIRFYLREKQALEPGQVVKTTARLRLTDRGGEREPTFHRAEGILLLGYQRGEVEFSTDRPTLSDHAARWRQKIIRCIETSFPADTFAFAKALVLGDTTDLTYEQSTAFSVSGISHVVAVSGLHVSILCAVVYLFSGRKRYLTALIGIPLLVFFAAIVGLTPSVTRAVLMQVLMMLAVVVDREYDPPTALAFAVMVMLTRCPLVITSVGFQLSVGSVAGIFLFFQPISEWLRQWLPGKGKGIRGRVARWVTSSVAVTLSATAVTTPLVAVYFHTVSLIGVVTNLAVLFVVSGIFYGVGLVCLVGLWFAGLAKAAAWVISWPIRYVLGVSGLLAKFPLAAVYTECPYIVFWLVFVFLLLFWLLVTKSRRPGLVVLLGGLGLFVSLMLSYLEPLTSDYRVTVLDVGQGQCVVLQSEGCTFLVDCGGDYDDGAADVAARTLLSQGIFRIDGLILTHYDRDHAGGVEYLAKRIAIDRLYLPQTEDSDSLRDRVLTASQEYIVIDSELEIAFGEARILLYPAKNSISGNDSSASVLFQRGKCDTLLTGDLSSSAERQLLQDYDLPDLEVLVVGHHGSKHSTCTELLQATAPDVAIISVGADNSYGHPTGEVLERLNTAGCAVFRTDLHGTITYRR